MKLPEELAHHYVAVKNELEETTGKLSRVISDFTRINTLFQGLVQQSTDGIVITSEAGIIMEWNEAQARITGIPSHEAVGKPLWAVQMSLVPPEIVTPDLRETVRITLEKVCRTGKLADMSILNEPQEIQRPDGQRRFVLTSLNPIPTARGYMLATIIRDITQHHRTQQTIQQANDQLLMLNNLIALTGSSLDATTVLELACHELGRTLEADQSIAMRIEAETRTGEIIAEFIQTPDHQSAIGVEISLANSDAIEYLDRYRLPLTIDNAQNHPDLNSTMRTLMRKRDITSLLIVPLHTGSTLHAMLCFGSETLRTFSENEVLLVTSVAQATAQALDNSLLHEEVARNNQRLRQEVMESTAQLRRLNRRMAAILNNTSDAIILTRADGRINITNFAFDAHFGYLPDELFNQPIEAIAALDYIDALNSRVAAVVEDGEKRRLEIVARRKDGSEFDADIAFGRVIDDETHVICSIRDITHIKEVERMKDNFISTVSHELRTPLTAVVLASSTLNTHYDRMRDDQRTKRIAQIHSQATVLAELIEAILDLSRLETRRHERGSEPVDLQSTLVSVINEQQPAAYAKNQTLTTETDGAPIQIPGSHVDITRIWRNLISNAIKYTDEGGAITVRMVYYDGEMPPQIKPFAPQPAPGRYVFGQVEDNGHGIKPEDMEQLFTRFYRGWAKQSNIPGTGLGLSLIRELLHLYGGEVVVESQLEQGSTFTFWIPLIGEKDQ